jgi:hypothetical protein
MAIYGTDSNGSYLRSFRLMLPYFLSSDKVKDTEKEIIASATQSLTQYLQTKTQYVPPSCCLSLSSTC